VVSLAPLKPLNIDHHIFCAEIDFPAAFARRRQRPYGVIYHTPDIPARFKRSSLSRRDAAAAPSSRSGQRSTGP
jgi:hypothetical protein